MPEKLFANNNPELLDHAKKMRREMTAAEQRLWHFLRAGRLQGYKFRRQQPMGSYIADFVCVNPKLIIEADGGQHAEQAAYDTERSRYFQRQGFTVLRFWNHQILQQTDDVLAEMLRVLDGLVEKRQVTLVPPNPLPNPPPRGREQIAGSVGTGRRNQYLLNPNVYQNLKLTEPRQLCPLSRGRGLGRGQQAP